MVRFVVWDLQHNESYVLKPLARVLKRVFMRQIVPCKSSLNEPYLHSVRHDLSCAICSIQDVICSKNMPLARVKKKDCFRIPYQSQEISYATNRTRQIVRVNRGLQAHHRNSLNKNRASCFVISLRMLTCGQRLTITLTSKKRRCFSYRDRREESDENVMKH